MEHSPDHDNFITEIEPLINGLVNPVAAHWLLESELFKQLQLIVDGAHSHTAAHISNRAVARYLSLQLELVESVFMPINNMVVQCIHTGNAVTASTMPSSMLRFIKNTSVLEHLRNTFMIEKARYWLGVLIKLNKLLLDAASPYYQLLSAADVAHIRALAAPWQSVLDRIKSRHGSNHPVLVLLLLMTQVSCISGWKTARSIFELNARTVDCLKRTDALANYRVVLQYFGRLKGTLVTCSDHVPLTQGFSFAASDSTLYHTTRVLSAELSAEDRASVLHYLRGEHSIGALMMRHELALVRCIDTWLYEA